MPIIAWLIFVAAATLEVAGNATMRNGLRGNRAILIAGGVSMLGCYGVVVNSLQWDFSRLLGVYVPCSRRLACSAAASVFLLFQACLGLKINGPDSQNTGGVRG